MIPAPGSADHPTGITAQPGTTPPAGTDEGGNAVARRARRKGWSSIERQLPLLICFLLVPIVVTLLAWGYRETRGTLLLAAATRLEGGAGELAGLLAQAAEQRLNEATRIAETSAIRDCLRAPQEDNLRAARQVFEPLGRRSVPRSVPPRVSELWSSDGTRVLSVKHPATDPTPVPELHAYVATAPVGPPGIQPIRMVGNTWFFEAVADVPATDAEAGTTAASRPSLGRVVLRRSLTGSQAMTLLGNLIATKASLILGNRAGAGAWTDLERAVPGPAVDPLDPESRVHRDANGRLRVGAGIAIRGTPWVLWAESDANEALMPARAVLWRMTAVGLVALLVGAFGAWLVSRRIVAPLRDATAAAEAMAAGQFDRRVLRRGADEVARLAEAFNVMAERIEEGRRELEDRVSARTADLSAAMNQLREAQDSLVRKERLAILGQLAGGVGHELRNPLGVMTNAVYYLEMVLDSASPEVREYLGILRRQVELSDKIITDLLDFARTRPPQCSAVRLQDLVEGQLARLGRIAVRVERVFPPDLPPAWVDPVQSGQVVFNLLTNALQAMSDGGTLTVRGSLEPGQRVRLEVADTGPGVPSELSDKIFEPLFTTRARGIGLGLSVSRRLAENNGGELRLERRAAGPGATFSLVVPAVAEAPAHV